MKILYLGDIMAEPGVRVVEQLLPEICKDQQLDVVVAQAENVTDGKGLGKADYERLRTAGVDAFTSGNWIFANDEVLELLNDAAHPVTRPANYPASKPGRQYKYVDTPKGRVLLVSILGDIVGKQADDPTDNPLKVIDQILDETREQPKVATVVNFHGDYSSQKVIFGHYLDGRASMVAGDHWHIPTADARVQPQGTAYITDVGMCGTLNSSLGVTFDSVIPRWRDNKITKNEIEAEGTLQLNGVIVDVDEQTGLARSITQVREVVEPAAPVA